MDTIYVEHDVRDHPRTHEILARYPRAHRVPCDRYGEVFNRRAQNFRLQKQNPALILARKHERHVLPIPAGTGFGGTHEYYFSHMLNCPYDCRYCFLQGMFQSAHHVMFVNYEDFHESIRGIVARHPNAVFFSGYDCDSLAFDSVTRFADSFLPLFESLDGGLLELRTKSVKVGRLLERDPIQSVVVAYSLTPATVAKQHEHGAPSIERRLAVLHELSDRGWQVGLRFDPMVLHPGYREHYLALLDAALTGIRDETLHSITLGTLRYPKAMYETLFDLYPEEPLFADLERGQRMAQYPESAEQEMVHFLIEECTQRVGAERVFPCRPQGVAT